MGYLLIAGCILFTVYGQIVLKWRVSNIQGLPESLNDKLWVLLTHTFTDIYIISGFVAAFIASLCWMGAISKFELSYAYPFMSFAFVIVMLFSFILFDEQLNVFKVVGTLLIIAGIYVVSRGYR